MDSRLVVVLVALAAGMSVAVALHLVLNRGDSDPYKGLPTSPIQLTLPLPKKHPAYKPLVDKFQPEINDMFKVRSDCWNVNYVYRKMMPEMMQAAIIDIFNTMPVPNGPWGRIKDSTEMKAIELALTFKLVTAPDKIKQELRKCDRNNVINYKTRQYTVGDILDWWMPIAYS